MANYTCTNTMDGVLTIPGNLTSLAVGVNQLAPGDWQAIRTSPIVREAMQRGAIVVKDPSNATITSTAAPVQQLKGGTATTVYSAYTLSDGA